ncbi:hypothetical protein G6F57_014716 [Rhizopus arrhizus]|nr:hypothetical protein G6F57_014716 [Rhizopus arrhizus]
MVAPPVAVPAVAAPAAVVISDDVSQQAAGGRAAHGRPRIAFGQQCARYAAQPGADDGIASLFVGLGGHADAHRQDARENRLNESFRDGHLYSPVAGCFCDAAMHNGLNQKSFVWQASYHFRYVSVPQAGIRGV